MPEPAHTAMTQDTDIVGAGETPNHRLQTVGRPHTSTKITRSPGGTYQSTVTVTVQVTTTNDPPEPPTGMQRSADEDDTNPGGGSKGSGLGATVRSPDEDDTNSGGGSKGSGLGPD